MADPPGGSKRGHARAREEKPQIARGKQSGRDRTQDERTAACEDNDDAQGSLRRSGLSRAGTGAQLLGRSLPQVPDDLVDFILCRCHAEPIDWKKCGGTTAM